MAFGSGSSLASDRWMRRRGLPSSAQLFNVGNASLLHQHSSQKPTAHVSGLAFATLINRSLAKLAFFLSYKGSGEVIHRLARIHLTSRRRDKVARMVSPETRLSVSPSSKAASAAISKVQRLEERREYEKGIEALQRAVSEEPTNEEVHTSLMRLYAYSERRG